MTHALIIDFRYLPKLQARNQTPYLNKISDSQSEMQVNIFVNYHINCHIKKSARFRRALFKRIRDTMKKKKDIESCIQSAKTVNKFWQLYINIFGIEKAANLYRFMERTIQHTKEINNADNFNRQL